MSADVTFSAITIMLNNTMILRLPEGASKQMSSRGQVAVSGAINNHEFRTVLEPDGYWGHWMRIDEHLQKNVGIHTGDSVTVSLRPIKEWPEPEIPEDIAAALKVASEKVKSKWRDITPMARWEWIRWVNATANMDTRAIRIEKTISKLNGTHRRPCCFNLAACTDPHLSKNGRLIEVASV